MERGRDRVRERDCREKEICKLVYTKREESINYTKAGGRRREDRGR